MLWSVPTLADGYGDIELFRAVVDAGGISAGAEALGSSPPAVSRRVKALEERLGVWLADRSARRFRLTDEGALYYEHCHTEGPDGRRSGGFGARNNGARNLKGWRAVGAWPASDRTSVG